MNEQTVVEKKRNSPPRGAGGAKTTRRYSPADKLRAVRLHLEEGFSKRDVTFDDKGKVVSYQPFELHQFGWTPFRINLSGPADLYDPAEGSLDPITDSGVGKKSITIKIKMRSRIGKVGQSGAWALLGTGVPYTWREMDYTLSSCGDYTIKYIAAFFPSQEAYFNDKSVGTRGQSGLAQFMFTPSGTDAPGAEFHT